jgi:hypothetical protein
VTTVAPDGALDDAIEAVDKALALVEPLVVEVLPDLLLHSTTIEQAEDYGAASVHLSDAWAGLRIALTTLKGIS